MKSSGYMSIFVISLGALGIGWYLKSKSKPKPHWQVGSKLYGEDPEKGWITLQVTGIQWRDTTLFDLNNTQYQPQWWYQMDEILSDGSHSTSGLYPEEFLKSAVRG